MTKQKLSKQEYILKAAKLYGLGKVEIEALKNHIDGTMENNFIERRCQALFRLYDYYKNDEDSERIKMNYDGVIDLNNYEFEVSKRRLVSSKIGRYWILGSNLDCFLDTVPAYGASTISEKFKPIAEKNNFLLPQVAKSMKLDAAVYYKGKYIDEYGTLSTHHLTKNFLNDDESFIEGTSIIKDNPKKKRIRFESLLEATDKYVKKYYKKKKLPEAELAKARRDIKIGLIKQTFFNKFVFNENESNTKWGLIQDKQKHLRLAPIYSYDYCCGVQPTTKTYHRCIDGKKEDIQTFMMKYGKEKWFRDWIEEDVLPFNLEKQETNMKAEVKSSLTDNEREYYDFLFSQMKDKVREVVDIGYDEALFSKIKKGGIFEIFSSKTSVSVPEVPSHEDGR